MNSKSFLLILGLFSFTLFSGCRDDQSQANIQPDGMTAIDTLSQSEFADGEFIEASEAELIVQSSYKIEESSLATLNVISEQPFLELPKLQKSGVDTCMIDFNSPNSLALMPDQAIGTMATWPYYIHYCNSGLYFIYTEPVNLDHFHLNYEHNYCYDGKLNIGIKSGELCLSSKEAKFWPRYATNMNNDTGIRFFAKSSANVKSNFNLDSVRIITGRIEVLAYRTDIKGWWIWRNLKPGLRHFRNNTNINNLYFYYNQRNGTFEIDDLKLTIVQ